MNARRVQPELLDELPPEQQEARESRRDLQRVNWLMGNARILRKAWKEAEGGRWCKRVVDMGGGDGTLLLRFLQALPEGALPERAVLVDREPVVSEATQAALARLGCEVSIAAADIFEWLEQTPPIPNTFLMTNLFLHHFEDEPLRRLLQLASRQCEVFAACEPRRSGLSLLGSRLLGVIGCNAVTRHDAVVSVQAGFCGKELSRLWPQGGEWENGRKSGNEQGDPSSWPSPLLGREEECSPVTAKGSRQHAANGRPSSVEWLLHEEETGLFSHFFWARKP